MKRKLSDQQDTAKRIRLDTQNIIENQASLAQSMSTQHTEVRDCLHSQARDQERAFASQSSATTQIAVNVRAQIEAITALQKSLTGFVSLVSPMRDTGSYVSDISQRVNALSGANAQDLA